MKIEGYRFVVNFNAEDTLRFPGTLPVDGIIVGNDAMWHYMTTGQIRQEEDTNGRKEEGTDSQSNC
jgi:hypothetical protein